MLPDPGPFKSVRYEIQYWWNLGRGLKPIPRDSKEKETTES